MLVVNLLTSLEMSTFFLIRVFGSGLTFTIFDFAGTTDEAPCLDLFFNIMLIYTYAVTALAFFIKLLRLILLYVVLSFAIVFKVSLAEILDTIFLL